jgi:hypothetical protein
MALVSGARLEPYGILSALGAGGMVEVYETEEVLRRDSHKWEPYMKASVRVREATLNDPVFDIHSSARRGGMNDGSAQPIPHALVVTVTDDSPDLYNKIAQRCRTMLEPLRPVIQIPVRSY